MRRSIPIAVLLLAAPFVASARCPSRATTASFLETRFGVGVRTLVLEDTSRETPAHGEIAALPSRTLVTEVWYPAEPGASGPEPPLARGGPFPLIVNSHGLMDFRTGEGYIASHLASRGFIVASADFPLTHLGTTGGVWLADLHNQPGDVRFIIDELLRRARTRGEWLRGGIRRRRIGAMGLSFGGATTLLVTYHPTLRDRRIRAALPIAPSACFFGETFYRSAHPPLLVMQGDEDLLVPLATNGARVFQLATRSPRTLVTLSRGTHTAFAGPVTFASPTTYDSIGCAAISGVEDDGDPGEGLGGAENGIDPSACALPCQGPAPDHPPMLATRQHDIARLTATAFFESTLGHSRLARCFLRERLAVEYTDVSVESAPGRR